MWNDQHREGVARNLVDGQRYPVERDRPLRCNETGKLCRRAKREPRHVGQILARNHVSEALGMTGDDVPAELIAELERALEIDARALPPAAGRGHPQRPGGGFPRAPDARALAWPGATTVRQTPLQAIEAPTAMVSAS